MDIYVTTFDAGDGTYLGVVGPFKSRDEVIKFFKHECLKHVRIEIDEDVFTPDEYLQSFLED